MKTTILVDEHFDRSYRGKVSVYGGLRECEFNKNTGAHQSLTTRTKRDKNPLLLNISVVTSDKSCVVRPKQPRWN